MGAQPAPLVKDGLGAVSGLIQVHARPGCGTTNLRAKAETAGLSGGARAAEKE